MSRIHQNDEHKHTETLAICMTDPAFRYAIEEVIEVLEKHSKIYAKSSNTCECAELVFAHAVVSTLLVKLESIVTITHDEFESSKAGGNA